MGQLQKKYENYREPQKYMAADDTLISVLLKENKVLK